MRASYFLVVLFSCVCLFGCVKGPSTDERSPQVTGRVLDSRTMKPLQGARISLNHHPAIATSTDASGNFVLRGTKNVHLFTLMGICSTSFPSGKYYGDDLDISRAGYIPVHIRAREYLAPGFTNVAASTLTLRNIVLMPGTQQ